MRKVVHDHKEDTDRREMGFRRKTGLMIQRGNRRQG